MTWCGDQGARNSLNGSIVETLRELQEYILPDTARNIMPYTQADKHYSS